MGGVRKLSHLKTKFMGPQYQSDKVYIVANNILCQNRSLFLTF